MAAGTDQPKSALIRRPLLVSCIKAALIARLRGLSQRFLTVDISDSPYRLAVFIISSNVATRFGAYGRESSGRILTRSPIISASAGTPQRRHARS